MARAKDMTFDELAAKYGTVTHEGETLALMGEATLAGPGPRHLALGDTFYKGYAVSRDVWDRHHTDPPCSHIVYWEITNPNAEDDADACDWDEYIVDKC